MADAMLDIWPEDECDDTYVRIRMYQALKLKYAAGLHIPSERTVYRVMEEIGLSYRSRPKPNGITKVVREAQKSDDLIKRNFTVPKFVAPFCIVIEAHNTLVSCTVKQSVNTALNKA